MAEIIELEDQIEKVILVGVSEQDGDDAEDSVAELAELVRTAGAVVVGTLTVSYTHLTLPTTVTV